MSMCSKALGGLRGRRDFPTIDELAETLRRIAADAVGSTVEDELDEWIEVRLQVVPDEGWTVQEGDPQHDTDHRGYWGASSVPGDGRSFNARDVARDMIREASDMAALLALQ